MRRLSPPLVVAVVLVLFAVIAEMATPEPWSELFIPLRLLAVALVIAASLLGILGVSQLRSPWGTLAIAIATLGLAAVVASSVATTWYGAQLREALFERYDRGFVDPDVLGALFGDDRWWSLVGSLGIVASIAGIGLVSRRIVPTAIAVAVAAVVGALTAHVWVSDFTVGDALAPPTWQHAAWLVGLVIVVWLAGAPSPVLASDGFRRAGQGLWIRALVLAITLGVALGGTPQDGDAHAFLHAITVAVLIASIIGFVVAAWGLVIASRLDEPTAARWLLAIAAGLLLVVAGAWITVSPALYDERIVSVSYYDNALTLAQGLAFVTMMIGLAAVVRCHGLHEIRGGAGFRIVVVIVLLAIVLALHVSDMATVSPRVIVRGILMIAASVIAARESTNVSHRLTRVPEMPTAKLL